MSSGMISSYKGYISSKKVYLKRKKQLNREIKHFKKCKRRCLAKGIKPRLNVDFINKRKDDVYILRLMWNYNKFGYRRKERSKKGLPVR